MFSTHTVRILAFLLILALALPGVAAAATPRIMLVGDSWAWYMWLGRSLQKALAEAGLEEYEEMGNFTAIPGSTSEQWTNPVWLENLKREIEKHPTVDIVHLSIGGNGYLRNWRGDMSIADRDKLFADIMANIEAIVDFILDIRPNIRVAICSYDYVNASRHSTIPELNQAGMILEGMKRDFAMRTDRVGHIHNYGLMQYHFGVPGVAEPGEVPYPGQAPDFDPFPGGLKNHWNAEPSMLDKIHLSPAGYDHLARHCVKVLYKEWLETPVSLEAVAAATE